MNDKKRPMVSYSLEAEYQELFDAITRETRRNKTEQLRIMLDMQAAMLGLQPVNPVDMSGLVQRKRVPA